MKQTLLGQSPHSYKKALNGKIRFCAITVIVTLILHIVLIVMRTQRNHQLLLIANIGCSSLCGFILVYQIFRYILPCRRLYTLYLRQKQVLEGVVTGISSTAVRYMDMDCYEVTAAGRRLFLPVDTIALQENETYRLSVTANTIVEAEQ